MPKTTFAGHPLHPMLILAPGSLLPFSLILDLMYIKTGKDSYAEAAYYSMMGGYIGGLAAATAGAGDYFAIPPNSYVKKIANLHALLNIGMLGLYSINLLLRRGKQPPTGTVPVLLSVLGTISISVSAWYGGDMVYTHGMCVEGVSPIADAPESRLPGDAKLAEMFKGLAEKIAPQDGPQT